MRDLETLTSLFDNKIIAVLAVLVNDSTNGLYLREISKYSGVSDSTTFRIIKKLMEVKIVSQQKIKKLKLYTFNRNENTDFIYNLLKKDVQVLQVFVEEAKKIENIQAILLHKEEANNRANVLIIGTNVDTGKVKELSGNIKEKYNFVVSPLVLTLEQFEQMSHMGLYSGKEKVLFKK